MRRAIKEHGNVAVAGSGYGPKAERIEYGNSIKMAPQNFAFKLRASGAERSRISGIKYFLRINNK